MTSMFAFPNMFGPHIKHSNLKQPDDFESYDPDVRRHIVGGRNCTLISV